MRAYHIQSPTTTHGCSLLWSLPWLQDLDLKSITLFKQWKDGTYSEVEFGSLIVSHQEPHPHHLGILTPRPVAPTPPDTESDSLSSRAEGLNAYMEDLRRFTVKFLYPHLRPTFGYIGTLWLPGKTQDDRLPYFANRRLTRIDWTNILGPKYVEEYGKDFLLGAPGYRGEVLPDGGILYQVTERFMNLEMPSPSEDDVVAYFKGHPKIARFSYKSRMANHYFVNLKRSRAARERYYARWG